MVKHFILWRYTDAGREMGEEKLVNELNMRFKLLIGPLEGLRHIHIRACDAKGDPGYHDLMLYAEFDDVESLTRYMADEEHGKIRDWDSQYVCDRAGFDFIDL